MQAIPAYTIAEDEQCSGEKIQRKPQGDKIHCGTLLESSQVKDLGEPCNHKYFLKSEVAVDPDNQENNCFEWQVSPMLCC